MSIEINNINPAGQDPLRGKRNEAKAAQNGVADSNPAEAKAPESSSTTVSLSNTAQVLGQVEAQLKQQSEVDLSRVEQLKTSISNGEYAVSPEALAQKMLDLE